MLYLIDLDYRAIIAFSALVISLISIYLTAKDRRRSRHDSLRPAIVIIYSKLDGWHAKNVGNGPAFNVSLSYLKENYDLPPISKDGECSLREYLKDDKITTVNLRYEDYERNLYSTEFNGSNNHHITHASNSE